MKLSPETYQKRCETLRRTREERNERRAREAAVRVVVDADPHDYRESSSCKALLKQIEQLVKIFGTVKARFINERIEIPRHWSLDDILAVSEKVERIPGYVDTYVYRKAQKGIPKPDAFQVTAPSDRTYATGCEVF